MSRMSYNKFDNKCESMNWEISYMDSFYAQIFIAHDIGGMPS